MVFFGLFRKRRVVVRHDADWLAALTPQQRRQLARNLREIVAYKEAAEAEAERPINRAAPPR